MLIRYSFILGSQNDDFWAAWAETTNQPTSKQITFHRRDFMHHVFFMNCLAFPKGVKYKRISNKKAV